MKKKESKKETLTVEKVEDINKLPPEAYYNWKKAALGLILVIIGLILFIYMDMFTNSLDKYEKYGAAAGAVGIFIAVLTLFIVNKSVGLDFIVMVQRAKKLRNKGFVMLKIHNLTKIPQHQLVHNAPWIHYTYKENGVAVPKRVMSDPLAVHYEFGGVPVVETTPNDIFLLNRFTGTRITTSPELIDKHINDTSKTAKDLAQYKKYTKYAVMGLVGLAIAVFVMFDLYRQAAADATSKALAIAQACNADATIIAGLNLTGLKAKEYLDKIKGRKF